MNSILSSQVGTFSQQSENYAAARPYYPEALFHWIASQCETKDTAWDCATGNGQSAKNLASIFKSVQATDISAAQLDNAFVKPNVTYRVLPAEKTDFPDNSFDLITVAQAMHWFDFGRFWQEVSRVAKPGALFCAWGYAWFTCDAALDDRFVSPFKTLIEPFWAEENKILWNGYQLSDIRFPCTPIETPKLSIDLEMSFEQLLNYFKTWSAYKRAMNVPDVANSLELLINQATTMWSKHAPFQISMPLSIVAGRIPQS